MVLLLSLGIYKLYFFDKSMIYIYICVLFLDEWVMFRKVLCGVCSILMLQCIYVTNSAELASEVNNLNDCMCFLNPDYSSTMVQLTKPFAYDRAQELLKSKNSSETRMGTQLMIRLYNSNYGPVINLFDMACDERGELLRKSIETLEILLKEHFSGRYIRLGDYLEEEGD